MATVLGSSARLGFPSPVQRASEQRPAPRERQRANQTAQNAGAPAPKAPDEPKPGPQQGVVNFEEDPIGSIGLLLSNFGAGVQGRTPPSVLLKEQHQRNEAAKLRALQVGMQAMGAATQLARNAPAGKRAEVVRGALEPFKGVLGDDGIEAAVSSVETDPQRAAQIAELFGENAAAVMQMTGGDTQEMLKLAQDDDFMNRLEQRTDQRNAPLIIEKFNAIQEALSADPQGQEALAALAADGWTTADLRRLPKGFEFSESELNTIQRNETVQSELVPFGFVPSKTLQKVQETQATEAAKQSAKPIKVDQGSFKAALSMRMAGQDVTEDMFGEQIANQVGNMSSADAARVRQNLKGNALKVTLPDGTEIDFGGGSAAAEAGAKTQAREEAKGRVKAKDDFSLRSVEVTNLGNLLNKVKDMPEGATGLRAAATEGIGGILGQINPNLEARFAKLLSGATPEEISAFRTQARTAIAQNISTVSGEESGRFTEMERRVTESTLRVLEAGASKPQIRSALGELLSLKIMLRDFSRIKAGIDTKYDLTNEKSLKEFVTDMQGLGMMDDQVVDLALRLKSLRQQVEPAFKPEPKNNGNQRR